MATDRVVLELITGRADNVACGAEKCPPPPPRACTGPAPSSALAITAATDVAAVQNAFIWPSPFDRRPSRRVLPASIRQRHMRAVPRGTWSSARARCGFDPRQAGALDAG